MFLLLQIFIFYPQKSVEFFSKNKSWCENKCEKFLISKPIECYIIEFGGSIALLFYYNTKEKENGSRKITSEERLLKSF